jgi:vacuolar-type H+-ATPase subunit F/Vma7
MQQSTPPAPTRLIAMGQAPLMEGFRLIGVETHADASHATVERVLAELARSGARALVFLEHELARGTGPWLEQVRNEGGGIVVTELPPLAAPHTYAPAVDTLVRAILGPGALEEQRP